MNSDAARYIVAGVLLFFAWKGAVLQMTWPPSPLQQAAVPKPSPELLAWAEPVKKILPKMLPADRAYLSNFYDAMAFVNVQDSERATPIIGTTERWIAFHSTSLDMAIERAKVGKYPGLGEAIDEVFFTALGSDAKSLDKESRQRLIVACGVLSWTFAIHRDE